MRVLLEGFTELHSDLLRAMPVVRAALVEALEDLGDQTVVEIKETIASAPRVDTGELLHGIQRRTTTAPGGPRPSIVVTTSEAASRYALFVELDTRPHWPPRQPLESWASRHGVPVFLVQKAIAERGTTGIHMFETAYRELLEKVTPAMVNLGAEIGLKLGWGGVGTGRQTWRLL